MARMTSHRSHGSPASVGARIGRGPAGAGETPRVGPGTAKSGGGSRGLSVDAADRSPPASGSAPRGMRVYPEGGR